MNIKKWLGQLYLPVFLVIVSVIGYGIYFNINRSLEFKRWTTHTHEVMTQINETQAKVYNMDAIFMRYAIKKDPHYLELYRQELIEVIEAREQLQNLTADNPVQQENIKKLMENGGKRKNLRESVIDKDVSELHKVVVSPENNHLRETVASRFQLMMSEERRLLEEREATFQQSIVGLLVLVGMLAVALAGAFGFITGEIHAQKNILSNFINGI